MLLMPSAGIEIVNWFDGAVCVVVVVGFEFTGCDTTGCDVMGNESSDDTGWDPGGFGTNVGAEYTGCAVGWL